MGDRMLRNRYALQTPPNPRMKYNNNNNNILWGNSATDHHFKWSMMNYIFIARFCCLTKSYCLACFVTKLFFHSILPFLNAEPPCYQMVSLQPELGTCTARMGHTSPRSSFATKMWLSARQSLIPLIMYSPLSPSPTNDPERKP
jgi:hypothetical protein